MPEVAVKAPEIVAPVAVITPAVLTLNLPLIFNEPPLIVTLLKLAEPLLLIDQLPLSPLEKILPLEFKVILPAFKVEAPIVHPPIVPDLAVNVPALVTLNLSVPRAIPLVPI